MKLKKEEVRPRSEKDKRLEQMRHGRIEKTYLLELVMDYKMKRQLMPTYPMPTELAEVILIIVDKMLGSGSWRNYTDDWKEEMRGRAIEHVLRYAHNFNPIKVKNDPYNYFAMIIYSAFVQSWRKCKTYSEQNVALNEEVIHNSSGWDDESNNSTSVESVTPNIDALDWGYF